MEHTLFEFTEKEQAAMRETASRIDITQGQTLLMYGAAAQKKTAELCRELTAMAEARDPEELNGIAQLTTERIRGFYTEERIKRNILGLFKKREDREEMLRKKTDELSSAVAAAGDKLEKYQLELMKSMEVLEQKYMDAQSFAKMLSMYVQAGKMKLTRERETTLANMREIARRTELAQDGKTAEAFERDCKKFERKLRDLAQTGSLCMELQPVILKLKTADSALSDALHDALLGPVGRWKQTFSRDEACDALERIVHVQADSMLQRESARKQLLALSEKLQQKIPEGL